MRKFNTLSFASVLLTLVACKTDAVRTDVPARVIDPTRASRAELHQAVGSMLGGRSVTLADDALTKDSLLIVEPKNLTGRDFGRPEHFRLVLRESRCALVHEESDSRFELMKTDCSAE